MEQHESAKGPALVEAMNRVTEEFAPEDVEQEQPTGEVVVVPGPIVAFLESAPWRPVQSLKARLEGRDPCDPTDPVPCEHQREWWGDEVADPHWYVIRNWRGMEMFGHAANAIQALGYKAEYIRPYNPRPLINDYLELGEFVYWYVYPNQLCRTKSGWNERRVLGEQLSL